MPRSLFLRDLSILFFLSLFPRDAVGGSVSSGPLGNKILSFSSISFFNCRRTRICANFCGESKSQKTPDGLGARLGTRMTRVGVTIISTGTSCFVSFPGGMSETTCSSCTVVTTNVVSASRFPCNDNIPHSNSANPSPFPTRAPVFGQTAVLPTTTKSTVHSSFRVIGVPNFTTPFELVQSFTRIFESLDFTDSICKVEKKPVRRRGWGVNNVFPLSSTACLTGLCGVSGFTFTHFAISNSFSDDKRFAAASAPTKLGMR
mmetsp:Transcript_11343/g.16663  ORF Transcript_11343/g.16663 Transcript_11343/m.16663 type:complete len:260 (-) Transcript_11343:455-1234(-)